MTGRLFTFIDVNATGRSIDEAETTNTFSILTHFSGATVLLLVAAHPARGLYTDLSAEAVLVAVTHLGAQTLQTPLALGAVGVDLALGVTQTLATPVTRRTLTWRRTFSRLVTKL